MNIMENKNDFTMLNDVKKDFDMGDNSLRTPSGNEKVLGIDPLRNPSGDLTESLLKEELENRNNIITTISDPSPVVILFGAGQSGKTMTLIRLTRFLRSSGYKVVPDRTFRPAKSKYYQKMCDDFDSSINSPYAADSTKNVNFMLVKILSPNGKPICQILEAPGEHYFKEDAPKAEFPTYINAITQLHNRKTWIFIVECEWLDQLDRNNYAQKIVNMQNLIDTKDKVIFMCHKADRQPHWMPGQIPIEREFFRYIKNYYPNIFDNYINNNPVTKLWRKYNFDFIVFSSGLFNQADDNKIVFNQGKDRFPAKLWKSILKTIKGSWSL